MFRVSSSSIVASVGWRIFPFWFWHLLHLHIFSKVVLLTCPLLLLPHFSSQFSHWISIPFCECIASFIERRKGRNGVPPSSLPLNHPPSLPDSLNIRSIPQLFSAQSPLPSLLFSLPVTHFNLPLSLILFIQSLWWSDCPLYVIHSFIISSFPFRFLTAVLSIYPRGCTFEFVICFYVDRSCLSSLN